MSKRNGDRARFHKDRKRKLRHRQRIQALALTVREKRSADSASRAASVAMTDEGGPPPAAS
jgi:hypothetical protein